MASLTFSYSAMGAGKSIELLKISHNYTKQGKKVWVLTSALDDRTGIGAVTSRIGLSIPAEAVSEDIDMLELYKEKVYDVGADDYNHVDCILVDEAQFFTPEQISDLSYIVDEYKVPVICFGLKNDFRNKLFPGSEALLLLSDKLVEMKTVCVHCTKKATMNKRMQNGQQVIDGSQVMIGGDDTYEPVCRYHYYKDLI